MDYGNTHIPSTHYNDKVINLMIVVTQQKAEEERINTSKNCAVIGSFL